MLKWNHLCICALLAANTTSAQVKWPAITQTAKPWTRWWWEGSAVTESGLTSAMEKYKQAGLGGLEVTPIYGVKGQEKLFIPFLSDRWMHMLDYTLQEGKRLGLGIDMATGTGWPFGGPWVTDADASKYVTYKTYTLKAGTPLSEPVQFIQEPIFRSANNKPFAQTPQVLEPISANTNLQELAIDQVRFRKPLPLVALLAYDAKGAVTDITGKVDANGKLNWTPTGDVTLYALFQGWHGKMVERAAPGGEGMAIDHFSLPAIQHYLGHFDTAFKGHSLAGLRSFFNDSYEVDDARGQSNWTPGFFAEFKQRRGYDLQQQLPALFAKDGTDKHTRVLYDYRMTVSELLLEKFTQPWHGWAKSKQKLIRNQSHGSPSNILDLYEAIDIPETEGTDILRFKFATSAASFAGKQLASAEAATWLDDHFLSTLGDVKQSVDKYFIGGVNHIFYHGTNYSPTDSPWPGWLFYAAVHFTPSNPFWRDFDALNKYVAHCQSFLQQGRADNDVLLYFPFHDRNCQPGRDMLHHFDGMEGFEKTAFQHAGEEMLTHGYTFDLVSDKQLLSLKNNLQSAGGKYQAILLADVQHIPLVTFEKLLEQANNGATLLFYKNMPADVPGLHNAQSNQTKLKALKEKIRYDANGIAKYGKGRIILGNDIDALLEAGRVRSESLQGLQFVRRATSEGTVYFITNTGTSRFNGYVTPAAAGKYNILFDPMQERAGLASTRTGQDGKMQIMLQLEVGESCILKTGNVAVTGSVYPYVQAVGAPQNIAGSWQLQFLEGGPALPATATLSAPKAWTDSDQEGVKQFSGTAKYTTRFEKPDGPATATAWVLDLGKVSESAEVILNGKSIGKVLGPTYKLTIPVTALKGDNQLEIVVTNGMRNRIIDMEKKGINYKNFYNTNFPSKKAENRGADGLFTAANWQPAPAGLLSDVTLTPVSVMQDKATGKEMLQPVP
ncbi:glycosyl hydrolase [Chitinophaga horti]|uniref:Glycosyl hydrolase n=1 Tax=Chitinophaga horti TaxID=2920382 RepID=A0ABY6J2Z3_9BACT|nr:glycosyl hydrolase [Chitinophaga horti]UYQ94039.1 glycosyl hydrolase [Chitinophaga horti]